MTQTERRDIAKRLLIRYFKTAFQGAGLRFDEANEEEVGEIVDLIFGAISRHESEDAERDRARKQSELDFGIWRARGPSWES